MLTHLILKTVLTIILIIVAVIYVIVKMYRRSLDKFRDAVRPGNNVRLRVNTEFINVLVIRRGSPGTILVKQFGRNRIMFVSMRNVFPA